MSETARFKLGLILARFFWEVGEWFEAIGNSFEDWATVTPGYRKWPRYYKAHPGDKP